MKALKGVFVFVCVCVKVCIFLKQFHPKYIPFVILGETGLLCTRKVSRTSSVNMRGEATVLAVG